MYVSTCERSKHFGKQLILAVRSGECWNRLQTVENDQQKSLEAATCPPEGINWHWKSDPV